MAQDETRKGSSATTPDEGGAIFVPVPPEHVQAVINFIAGLRQDTEDDVRGHMLSLGNFGGIGGGALNETIATTKNCVDTKGGQDRLCDSDVYTKF